MPANLYFLDRLSGYHSINSIIGANERTCKSCHTHAHTHTQKEWGPQVMVHCALYRWDTSTNNLNAIYMRALLAFRFVMHIIIWFINGFLSVDWSRSIERSICHQKSSSNRMLNAIIDATHSAVWLLLPLLGLLITYFTYIWREKQNCQRSHTNSLTHCSLLCKFPRKILMHKLRQLCALWIAKKMCVSVH